MNHEFSLCLARLNKSINTNVKYEMINLITVMIIKYKDGV